VSDFVALARAMAMKKQRAEALRSEAKVFQQSDPTRAANLRRDADELDPPRTKLFDPPRTDKPKPVKKRAAPRKKRAAPRKRGR
jgi:hypothetical protein